MEKAREYPVWMLSRNFCVFSFLSFRMSVARHFRGVLIVFCHIAAVFLFGQLAGRKQRFRTFLQPVSCGLCRVLIIVFQIRLQILQNRVQLPDGGGTKEADHSAPAAAVSASSCRGSTAAEAGAVRISVIMTLTISSRLRTATSLLSPRYRLPFRRKNPLSST